MTIEELITELSTDAKNAELVDKLERFSPGTPVRHANGSDVMNPKDVIDKTPEMIEGVVVFK